MCYYSEFLHQTDLYFVNVFFPVTSGERDHACSQLQSAEPWSQSAEITLQLLHRVMFTVNSKRIHIERVRCPNSTLHFPGSSASTLSSRSDKQFLRCVNSSPTNRFLALQLDRMRCLTFPTYSGSVPVYSSTTKNWFHTHPLLTRSSDEAPWSPPEIELLVLEASHQPKLQQLKRPKAANSVPAPTVQDGAILIIKRKKKERNLAWVYM